MSDKRKPRTMHSTATILADVPEGGRLVFSVYVYDDGRSVVRVDESTDLDKSAAARAFVAFMVTELGVDQTEHLVRSTIYDKR